MSEIPTFNGINLQTVKAPTPAPHGMQTIQSVDQVGITQVDENGVASSIGNDPFGRVAFAKQFNKAFNDFQLDSLISTANVFLGGAAGTGKPDKSTVHSWGAYIIPGGTGASSGYINWGLTDLEVQIMSPASESWLVSARVMFNTPTIQAGRWIIPVGILNNAATAGMLIEGIQAVSATVFKLTNTIAHNAGAVVADLGAVGTLGSATCPVSTFFWVSLGFDVGTGLVTAWFNDVPTGSFAVNPPNSACAIMNLWSFDATDKAIVSDIFRAGMAPF